MTVKEIVAKLPLAETYELSADKRYLIVFDPTQISQPATTELLQVLEKQGIKAALISSFRTDGLRIFDMEAPNHP